MGNHTRFTDCLTVCITVISTSTRNFSNCLWIDANVYLGSVELAAVYAQLGKNPSVAEYIDAVKILDTMADDIYRYLNFNEIEEYQKVAEKVIPIYAA